MYIYWHICFKSIAHPESNIWQERMSVVTVSRLSKLSSSGLSCLHCFMACRTLDNQSRWAKSSIETPKRVSIPNKLLSEYQKKENRHIGSAKEMKRAPSERSTAAKASANSCFWNIFMNPNYSSPFLSCNHYDLIYFFLPLFSFLLFWCLVFWLSPLLSPKLCLSSWVNVLISSSFHGVPIAEWDAIPQVLLLADF